MTAPTILRPAPDLPTSERTTDVEAWRARNEAKRQRAHEIQAAELAALVSQIRAGKRPPRNFKMPPEPKPPRVRKLQPEPRWHRLPTVAPCPVCGTPTRSSRRTSAEFPGTVLRGRAGVCVACERGAK